MADRGGSKGFADPPTDAPGWDAYRTSSIVQSLPPSNVRRRDPNDGDTVVDGGVDVVIVEDEYEDKHEWKHNPLKKRNGAEHQLVSAQTATKQTNFRLVFFADVLLFSIPSPYEISGDEVFFFPFFQRALTSVSPIELLFKGPEKIVFNVWTSVLDQPWHVTCNGTTHNLELGPETGHLGVEVTYEPSNLSNELKMAYHDSYPAAIVASPLCEAHVRTELRLATVLFWSHPNLATSICAYIVKLTADVPENSQLNAQAASLGRQLTTRLMMESNATFVPELNLDQFKTDTGDRIEVWKDFNDKYEKFHEKADELQMQIDYWNVMVDHTDNERQIQGQRTDDAFNRFSAASRVADECKQRFDGDDKDLKKAEEDFKRGIEEYKARMLFFAIFDFLVDIAKLFLGDTEDITKVLEDIMSVAHDVNDLVVEAGVDGKISGATLSDLGESMASLATIFRTIKQSVEAAKAMTDDNHKPGGGGSVPPITGNVTGSGKGDADASAIVSLGAWDKWSEDSDQQLQVVVDKGISGAAAYRAALRKHAINGKTLAQAQAHAVEVGQQYIQLQMDLVALDSDLEALKELREKYTDLESDIKEQAEELFWDRLVSQKVGVLMDLQMMAAAYRYYALEDYPLELDIEASADEVDEQCQQIASAVLDKDMSFDKDFPEFDYESSSERLPGLDHAELVQDLKDPTKRAAKFTLTPVTKPGADMKAASRAGQDQNDQGLPKDFHNGFHWRQWGMDATLRGAKALKGKGTVTVNIWAKTEGVFSDITGDGRVMTFTGGQQSKLFAYELDDTGKIEHPVTSIKESEKHIDRTPFTQWTIEIEKGSHELLDLSGLTGLDMHWHGTHMPIEPPQELRRDSAVEV